MIGHLPSEGSLDTLSSSIRAAWLAHARECAPCRERLLADDPTALFAFLSEVEISPAILASVSAGVAADLDREMPRRSWLAPAAAWGAAAALAVGLLVPAAFRHPSPSPLARSTAPTGLAPRAGIEAVRTPGAAQVLDLTVGDTQVVMIFDAELSL